MTNSGIRPISSPFNRILREIREDARTSLMKDNMNRMNEERRHWIELQGMAPGKKVWDPKTKETYVIKEIVPSKMTLILVGKDKVKNSRPATFCPLRFQIVV